MRRRSHRQPDRWVGAGELSPAAVLTLLRTSGQRPCLLRTAAVSCIQCAPRCVDWQTCSRCGPKPLIQPRGGPSTTTQTPGKPLVTYTETRAALQPCTGA